MGLTPTLGFLVSQFYYMYVPISYIDAHTGTTTTGYVKFTFYNAKSGKIIQFYNNANNTLLTPEKMYFKMELNLVDKKWKFLNILNGNTLDARQLMNSGAYDTRIDNTFVKFDAIKQTFPTGTIHSYLTNKYTTQQ